jgi:PRC-barrel domain
MLSKFLAAAVLGSALIAAPAMAQSNNKMNAATTKAATTSETASAAGLWQGSKLVGLNVYNDANEKIGAIKELMVDKSGNIASAVISVGGFLGMGEHDVAVKFADLKWSNEPVPSTTTGTNTTNRPATTGTATTKAANGPRTYPDHAVFNASKDQLKAMPQFDYNK